MRFEKGGVIAGQICIEDQADCGGLSYSFDIMLDLCRPGGTLADHRCRPVTYTTLN